MHPDLATPASALDGSRVAVTGATGLIGSAICRLLLERNRETSAAIEVVALVRDSARAREGALHGYGPDDGLRLVEGDLLGVPLENLRADWVVHAACPTASGTFVAHPAEVFDVITTGTRRMVELARSSNARGLVYLSSMEVYGAGNDRPGLDHLLCEGDVGAHDPQSPRSCYPLGKLAAEHICSSAAAEYGVPAKTVRLAQTFGPGVPATDGRLFMQIARAARDGSPVILRTTGASTRMYLHTDDAVSAILTVLTQAPAGSCTNAANPDTYCSVLEMAEMVTSRLGRDGACVRIELDENAPYPPEHHLPLDVSRLTALGWTPRHDLEETYAQLIATL